MVCFLRSVESQCVVSPRWWLWSVVMDTIWTFHSCTDLNVEISVCPRNQNSFWRKKCLVLDSHLQTVFNFFLEEIFAIFFKKRKNLSRSYHFLLDFSRLYIFVKSIRGAYWTWNRIVCKHHFIARDKSPLDKYVWSIWTLES